MQTLREQGLEAKAIVNASEAMEAELSEGNLPTHRQDCVSGGSASWQRTTEECSYGRDGQRRERADKLCHVRAAHTSAPAKLPPSWTSASPAP